MRNGRARRRRTTPTCPDRWRADRDLKMANKGQAWAGKAAHILQAKKELKEDNEGWTGLSACKKRKAILPRAQLLAEKFLEAIQEASFMEALSNAGSRIDKTAAISEEYDVAFNKYMDDPTNVDLKNHVEELEAKCVATSDYQTLIEKGDHQVAFLKALAESLNLEF